MALRTKKKYQGLSAAITATINSTKYVREQSEKILKQFNNLFELTDLYLEIEDIILDNIVIVGNLGKPCYRYSLSITYQPNDEYVTTVLMHHIHNILEMKAIKHAAVIEESVGKIKIVFI